MTPEDEYTYECEQKVETQRAQLAAMRDRLQTTVDEQIGIEPTLTAEELLTKIYNALAENRANLPRVRRRRRGCGRERRIY